MVGSQRVSKAEPLTLPDDRSVWPEQLRPRDEGEFEKETFNQWWIRNGAKLRHLPPELCEQRIYRHWTHTRFRFLPLDNLSCERRWFAGEELLGSIYRAFGGDLHPQFDYKTFQRRGGEDRHPTAVALDSGSWDCPMVLLSTPNGIVDLGQNRPEVRHVIVEGHQRHRYLNALHMLGNPPIGPHEVFILTSPTVGQT